MASTTDSNNKRYIGGWGYRAYKHYVRFMSEKIMYRHVYYLNKENIPALGEPCMIVSNHQNCANDPLNLLLGLENCSHPYVIARGNVFSWHPLITKFFLWLGMLPAFRLNYDGFDSLEKNAETIRISGGKLLDGNRLIMYPEGGHQDKRWLGEFSFGYTRMAFETAASDNFEHDIKILPCAHHYSDYFEIQSDVLIRFGTPISLKPYYELYKSKPRTAQREVNRLVREQIEQLMLDIRDLEHYNEIDWLRNSEAGIDYCLKQQLNPSYLPDKQISDKRLVARLSELTDEQKAVFSQIKEVATLQQQFRLSEEDLMNPMSALKIVLSVLAQVALLPLWLVSLFPNIIHYNIYRPFLRSDRMFTNSWRFIIPVVVGVPFWFLLVVLVCGFAWGWWWQSAILMLLSVYPLSVFAFYEWKWMCRTWRGVRMLCQKTKVNALKEKRKQLFKKINDILNKK